MDASDRTRRKMQQAITCNFQTKYSTLPNSIAQGCIFSGPYPVRYPSYEFRNAILSECCPIITPAVEEMCTLRIQINGPVSFSIGTVAKTKNLIVNWGDGSSDIYETTIRPSPGYFASVTHLYSTNRIYTITISSPANENESLFTLSFNDENNNTSKILSVQFTNAGKLYLTEVTLNNNLLTSIDISNCGNMANITLSNNNLTTINLTNVDTLSILLNIDNNNLSTQTIIDLFSLLLSYGIAPAGTNGAISTINQTPPAPISLSEPSKLGLEALGWRVLTDLPSGTVLNFTTLLTVNNVAEDVEFDIYLDTPNVTFQVDWADGSAIENFTSSNVDTPNKRFQTTTPVKHTYNTTGSRWPSIFVPTTAKISAIIIDGTLTVNKITQQQFNSILQSSLLYVDFTGNDVVSLEFGGFSVLKTIIAPNNNLNNISVDGCTLLDYLNVRYNEITNINDILIALDGNGVDGGTAYLDEQTPPAIPDGDGDIALATLLAAPRLWTITVDS